MYFLYDILIINTYNVLDICEFAMRNIDVIHNTTSAFI